MTEVAEPPTHPAYGRLRAVTDTVSVLLADNPGLMTLEGTNTWVLRGPRSELVIVDPAPTTTSTSRGLPRWGASVWC